MRQYFSTPLLLSVLVLSACSADTGTVVDSNSSSSMPMDDASSSADATVEGTIDLTDARIIEMTADDWSFSPSSITAKQGEKIVIRLKGAEGVHSFAIADLGINVSINPGETKDIEIPTDKVGTLAFRCRIPCGEGHMDMKGEIIVEAA